MAADGRRYQFLCDGLVFTETSFQTTRHPWRPVPGLGGGVPPRGLPREHPATLKAAISGRSLTDFDGSPTAWPFGTNREEWCARRGTPGLKGNLMSEVRPRQSVGKPATRSCHAIPFQFQSASV